jgi:branched-chain amino acid transport system permease protein
MRELRRIFKKPLTLGILILLILVLAALPNFIRPYQIISLITILMYVILTLSWSIFSGPTRYVSLGTAAFFGIGVYTSAVLNQKLPLPVIILVGGLISGTLALFIGLLTLRLKGIYFILFTFGTSALIRHSLQWWEINITRTIGRFVRAPASNVAIYYYVLGIFALTVLIAFALRQSRFGWALAAIGDNEKAAEHIGINVTILKVLTFALTAVLMGGTGAVMAFRFTYIDPTISFNPLISFLPVVMAIFGGRRIFGPIVGATLFTLLQLMLITEYPYYFMLVMGITLIIVIMYLPDGLTSLIDKAIPYVVRYPTFGKLYGKLLYNDNP